MEHFKAFRRSPKKVGWPFPTSRYTAKRMAGMLREDDRYIIELGTGNGTITRQIIKQMSLEARLLSFERDAKLLNIVSNKIKDARVCLINDDAHKLEEYLQMHGFERIDCIVSTLPLIIFSPAERKKIIEICYSTLKPGGRFVQIQYLLVSKNYLEERFSKVKIVYSLPNLPPSFIYICEK